MSEYFISYEVLNLVGAQLIKEDFSQFTGFVGWDFAFLSANWYRTLIYPTTEPDIMPPDESTPLMPEARLLNWRQRCCTHFSWGCFFAIVYFLLLLADVAVSIHFDISTIQYFNKIFPIDSAISFPATSLPQAPEGGLDPENEINDISAEGIVFNGIDTLICWIFLAIVATSPRFVGCYTTVQNLIRLSRFWILAFLFVLYIIGASVLPVISSRANKVMIAAVVADLLNAFTKVALIGVLNHVQVRNMVQGHSRYKYWLLKGTLGVIWIHLICILIGTIVSVEFYLSNATNVNNRLVHQVGSLTKTVTEVLLLPLVIKTTELIWTKICHDYKCIIGKYNSNRQNSRISYAIEFI